MHETVYEKCQGGYNIGVDICNQPHLIQLGNLTFKKEAKSLNRYSDNRIWYWSNQKLI